jgi:hypothetical protein
LPSVALGSNGIIREFRDIKEVRAGMRSLNSLNSLNSLIRWHQKNAANG